MKLTCQPSPSHCASPRSWLISVALAFIIFASHAEDLHAQSSALVEFSSDEGMTRLARSVAKADFAVLANQFEAQSNSVFCGPTTAAIVLNALHGRNSKLPRERSRLRADDLRFLPKGADPSLPRFTQDNVIEKGKKTRAQVFGEALDMDGKVIQDFGYQLRQLDEMLRANGVQSKLVVVTKDRPDAEIRADIISNLGRADDFVVVNYQRKAVGQNGGGHISPLAAYDAGSDSFLVLDVNPAAAGWVWMPANTLIAGMRSFDTLENRGYLLLSAP